MKAIWFIIKFFGYGLIVIILLAQLLTIMGARNYVEIFARIGLILVIGLFFAIRWQKKNKKTDDFPPDT